MHVAGRSNKTRTAFLRRPLSAHQIEAENDSRSRLLLRTQRADRNSPTIAVYCVRAAHPTPLEVRSPQNHHRPAGMKHGRTESTQTVSWTRTDYRLQAFSLLTTHPCVRKHPGAGKGDSPAFRRKAGDHKTCFVRHAAGHAPWRPLVFESTWYEIPRHTRGRCMGYGTLEGM